MHEETVCGNHYHGGKRISWSAVLTGALFAFGLTFLFNLLTVGVGLAIYTPDPQGQINFAIGGFFWTLIVGSLLLFVAGWKTGMLIKHCPICAEKPISPPPSVPPQTQAKCMHKCRCTHSVIHGFLAWVVYLVISLIFLVIVAYSASIAFLKISFMNIPIGQYQTENQQVTTTAPNQQRTPAVSEQTPTETARQTGAATVAVFIILLFGAFSMTLGSYFGLMAHKKCLEKKYGMP